LIPKTGRASYSIEDPILRHLEDELLRVALLEVIHLAVLITKLDRLSYWLGGRDPHNLEHELPDLGPLELVLVVDLFPGMRMRLLGKVLEVEDSHSVVRAQKLHL
jgi:hypothetical protein